MSQEGRLKSKKGNDMKTMLRCVAVLAGVSLACLGCGKEQDKPSAPPKAQPKNTADDGRGHADQCDHAGHKH